MVQEISTRLRTDKTKTINSQCHQSDLIIDNVIKMNRISCYAIFSNTFFLRLCQNTGKQNINRLIIFFLFFFYKNKESVTWRKFDNIVAIFIYTFFDLFNSTLHDYVAYCTFNVRHNNYNSFIISEKCVSFSNHDISK